MKLPIEFELRKVRVVIQKIGVASKRTDTEEEAVEIAAYGGEVANREAIVNTIAWIRKQDFRDVGILIISASESVTGAILLNMRYKPAAIAICQLNQLNDGDGYDEKGIYVIVSESHPHYPSGTLISPESVTRIETLSRS